jgi:hypothetical protein
LQDTSEFPARSQVRFKSFLPSSAFLDFLNNELLKNIIIAAIIAAAPAIEEVIRFGVRE